MGKAALMSLATGAAVSLAVLALYHNGKLTWIPGFKLATTATG